MIYKAVEVIWIFSVGRVDRTGSEGTMRGPRGNKNIALVWSSNYVSSQKLPLDGAVHGTLLSTALYPQRLLTWSSKNKLFEQSKNIFN